jgi:CxxC-x17-CxxC domain-containing protein
MGNFNRGGGRFDNRGGGRSFGGGGRSFGGGGGFGGRDRGRPDMHSATCSECGKECEVPFRPTGDKPVYCSDCFKNQGGGDRGGRERNRSFGGGWDKGGKGNFEQKKMYKAVCAECGNDCEVPFRPTGDKEVFCDKCFGRENDFKPKKTDDYKQEFDKLNSKLDRILKALEAAGIKKEDAIVKPVKEIEEEVKKFTSEKPKKAEAEKKEKPDLKAGKKASKKPAKPVEKKKKK